MEQTVQRRVRIIPAKRDTDTPQPGTDHTGNEKC